jgi:hypothetical protein
MGRSSVKPQKYTIVTLHRKYLVVDDKSKPIFNSAVPMSDGCYDRGGAYWGLGKQLRVEYTKDLTYIHFYRKGEE